MASVRRISPIALAVIVVAAWVVASTALFGLRYWSGHDESVYVAKAIGGRPPFNWGTQRSLGIPVLLSPVTVMGFGVTASRISILSFNAVLIAFGLWLWIRLLGRWAIIGPAAIIMSWLGLSYATAILPNLPNAAVLFATVPALWLAVTVGARRHQAIATAGFIAIGFLRPTALLWIVLGLAAAIVVDSSVRRHLGSLVRLTAVAIPLALATWVIESFATFSMTPMERIRIAGSAIGSYDHSSVVLTLLENLADPTGSSALALVIIGAALGASAILLVLAFNSIEDASRGALTLATCIGTAKLLAYVLFPSDGSARFLLPGLISASVGIGVGLRSLAQDSRGSVTASVILIASLFVWQLSLTYAHAEEELSARADIASAVNWMRGVSEDQPCYYESNQSRASFYLGTTCDAGRARDPQSSMLRMERRTNTDHSFLVWYGSTEPRPGWRALEIGGSGSWQLYHFSHAQLK